MVRRADRRRVRALDQPGVARNLPRRGRPVPGGGRRRRSRLRRGHCGPSSSRRVHRCRRQLFPPARGRPVRAGHRRLRRDRPQPLRRPVERQPAGRPPAARSGERRADGVGPADGAHRVGRRPRHHPAGASHQPDPGRAAALGWLARRHRDHLQPRPGDHPSLLFGRLGAGYRRRRRDRDCVAVELAQGPPEPQRPGRDPGRHCGVVVRPSASHADVASGPGVGRARRWYRRRAGAACSSTASTSGPPRSAS